MCHSQLLPDLVGCPAVVANLWDVTDRDIDRFSQCLLQSWTGEGDEESSSSHGGMGVSAAVNSSREACRLSHLIGAAPVCYGLPTHVTWKAGADL